MAAVRRARAREEIVRLVHRTTGVHDFARDVKRVLERAVPFDAVGLFTVDPATLLPTSHFLEGRLEVSNGVYRELSSRFIEIELREPDFNKYRDLARQGRRAASLSPSTGNCHRGSSRLSCASRTSTSTETWPDRGVAPRVSARRPAVISNKASAIASSADRLDTTTSFASCAQTPPGPGAT